MNMKTPGGMHIAQRHTGAETAWIRKACVNTLESFKHRWLAEALASVTDAALVRRLQSAAEEAASVAWATAYPLLALPELLAEKSREARRQFECQRAIQQRGRSNIRLAA